MQAHLHYRFDKKKSVQINVSKNNNIIRRFIVNQTGKINGDNCEKPVKKHHFSSFLNSKLLSNDQDNRFNFKTASWTLTVIYILSFIMVPILYSLIKTYAFHITKTNDFDVLFYYLIPLVGMAASCIIDWKTMIKQGQWAAYSHLFFGFLSALFVGFLLVRTHLISDKDDNPNSIAIQFLVQVLFQFGGSILVIWFCKPLRKRIITTLKEAKLDILLWIVIFFVITAAINRLFGLIPTGSLTDDGSKNQNVLELLKKTPFGIFTLILGTVFLAPINEEISYRQGSFAIVRYKWLGYFVSLIYFPAMHVMAYGDWNHITGYLSIAILMPLLFIITRGNVTYTIALHALWNLMATIIGFIPHN